MLSINADFQFAATSLFQVMLIISLIYGLIFWGLFRKDNLIEVNLWIKGCFYFCIGTLLVSTRELIPLFLGYAIGNFLIFYSHFMCFRSMEYMACGSYKKHDIIKLLFVFYGLSFIFLKTYHNDPNLIALFVGVSNFLFHSWMFAKLFRMRRSIPNFFAELIAYCYLASLFTWGIRIFLAQYYGFGESLDPGFVNWLSFLLLTMIFLVKHSFFFGLQLVRKSNQLDEITRLSSEKDDLMSQLEVEKHVAEKANLTKSQFLANVSHEIRTPLHGLIGMLSIVLRSPMSEEIKKSLDKALYSSKALLYVLNDILNFAKIEAGKIEANIEPFRLKQLFDDVSDLFLISATDKKIDLRFDLDPKIPEVLMGDFFKLRQVLFNLVGNSIKFTRHGSIDIHARLEKIEDQQVTLTISVKDTGVGISSESIEEIFQPFRQLDNTNTRNYDGVGLGLSIVQSILDAMNSQLNIKSQPGVGTDASFELCLVMPSNAQSDSINLKFNSQDPSLILIAKELSVGKRILVAEDNPINVDVIRHYLEFLKIDTDFVIDGNECLEAIEKYPYDLILMDIQMPIIDGIQATSQIRSNEKFKDLPIVGLSAAIAAEDREKSLRSGMNDYLVKPFELNELAEIIQKYLNR